MIDTPEGFSAALQFTSDNLSDIPDDPGVHIVWGADEEPLYVGYTSTQRSRIRQHLSGDRQASVLHKAVGDLLDSELGRTASTNEVQDWLGRCYIAWASDQKPKALKAKLTVELEPQFNKVLPQVEEADDDDPWDEFAYWASYFYQTDDFEAAERDYKIVLASHFAKARQHLLDAGESWIGALESAFGSKENNITRWDQHEKYLKWIRENSAEAAESQRLLWTAEDPLDGVNDWAQLTPKEAVPGPGARTMMASVLTMAVDVTSYPPYKPMALRKGYRLVGYEEEPSVSEAGIYRHALNFFDEVVSQCRRRDLELRDRLDAQGILWAILNSELDDPDDRDRLEAFRGAGFRARFLEPSRHTLRRESPDVPMRR